MFRLLKSKVNLWVVFLLLLPLFLFLIYLTFSPTSAWVSYKTIKPVKQDYVIGEDNLELISIVSVHRNANAEWIDILRCYKDDQIIFFSSYSSKGTVKKSDTEIATVWQYNSTLPTEELTCYIDSNLIVDIGFGFQKKSQTNSESFSFVYDTNE